MYSIFNLTTGGESKLKRKKMLSCIFLALKIVLVKLNLIVTTWKQRALTAASRFPHIFPLDMIPVLLCNFEHCNDYNQYVIPSEIGSLY